MNLVAFVRGIAVFVYGREEAGREVENGDFFSAGWWGRCWACTVGRLEVAGVGRCLACVAGAMCCLARAVGCLEVVGDNGAVVWGFLPISTVSWP